jgi:hypothetical protein
MEEKKTKKMTKAEAFEYLKEKKVDASINESEVQLKLFSIGVVWCTLDSNPTLGVGYLFIDKECHMTHCGHDFRWYKYHHYEEISVEDILSIEIVEEEKEPLDKWEEFASKVAKIQETLEDDEVCIITKTNFLTMTK